jgi:hypothetical protein
MGAVGGEDGIVIVSVTESLAAGAVASEVMKKPGSTTARAVALLPSSSSDNTSLSIDSSSGTKLERTAFSETAISSFKTPRLGSHTPSPRGKNNAGVKALVRRGGRAASMRVAQCTVPRCSPATWPPSPPRRGRRAADAGYATQEN